MGVLDDEGGNGDDVENVVGHQVNNGESDGEEEFQFDILEPAHIQLNFCTTHRNLRTLLQEYSSVHEASQQVHEDAENMKTIARLLPPRHVFSKTLLGLCFQILTTRSDYLIKKKLIEKIKAAIPCGSNKSVDVIVSKVDDVSLVQIFLNFIQTLEEMDLGPGWIYVQTEVNMLYYQKCDDAELIAKRCESLGFALYPYREEEVDHGNRE